LALLVDVVAGGDQRVHPVAGRPAVDGRRDRRLRRAAAEVAEGHEPGPDGRARTGGRGGDGGGDRGGGRGVAGAGGRGGRPDLAVGAAAGGQRPEDDQRRHGPPRRRRVAVAPGGHRRGPGRMGRCRWSSWLARVMTTLAGPWSRVRGPTKTYRASARTNRSTRSWARRRSTWPTRAGIRSRPSRRGEKTSTSRAVWGAG